MAEWRASLLADADEYEVTALRRCFRERFATAAQATRARPATRPPLPPPDQLQPAATPRAATVAGTLIRSGRRRRRRRRLVESVGEGDRWQTSAPVRHARVTADLCAARWGTASHVRINSEVLLIRGVSTAERYAGDTARPIELVPERRAIKCDRLESYPGAR